MKIALVSPIPMFPTIAGHASRIRKLAEAIIDSGHELTFFYVPCRLNQQVPDHAAHATLLGKGRYIRLDNGHVIERWAHSIREWPLRQWQKTLWRFNLGGGYSKLDQNYRSCWTRQLADASSGFEVVLVEYAFISRAFEAFAATTRRLLDTHDSFTDRHLRYARKGMRKGFWLSLRASDENVALRRADAALAIQDEEGLLFRKQLTSDGLQPNPEIAVVSHVLDLGNRLDNYSADNAAVFVGSNNGPNRYSMERFLKHVLPLVVREIPAFQLKVAGRICEWMPDTPNVTKLGFVRDLKAVYESAPLSINPVLLGSGINIKLLEAMSAAVATISTETGTRGLPESFSNGVVLVPDADHEQHAAQIVRYARSAALRRAKGEAAFSDAQRWNAAQREALQRVLKG
jgi:polysaccharide biosynthesis protein PslH